MSLCEGIDTLSMAYLDDELAAEERRELELHLTECTGCRAHVDAERTEKTMLRKALLAPPAPDVMRARLSRMLDTEERAEVKAMHRRWSQWVLPAAALAVGAAAIALFVGVKPPVGIDAVASEGFRVQSRPLPLEVSGPTTGNWVRANFPAVQPPEFDEPGIVQRGARLVTLNGHDGVLLAYDVHTGRETFVLTALALANVHDGELQGGDEVRVGNRTLHVMQDDSGRIAVTYVDANHRGYMFLAPALAANDLVRLVVASNLLGNH
jgi:hypothetical protein